MEPEERARKNIDRQLGEGGWQVQNRDELNIYASKGVAVREFAMPGVGEADYLLYADGKAIGVVEAKPEDWTLKGVELQSGGYMGGLPEMVPAFRRPLPFGYETTGTVTQFTNALEPEARSREVFAFHRPEELVRLVQQKTQVREALEEMPSLNTEGLWPAQIEAIENLERSLTKKPTLVKVGVEASSASTANGFSRANSVPDGCPLPLAFSWSLLASLWDPRDRYREQLRHAENMLAFLGSVSLTLLEKEDYEGAQIDLKVPWQGGISFGAWKLIVQRSSKVFRTYKHHPLASAIQRLNIGSEKKGFGADVAALINMRNNYHHGRGPLMEEEIIGSSNEAQERLQRCMEVVSFLAQYPIRLVQDFDLDRHSGEFVLKCLRLAGDGPGFPQESVIFPEALPRGDLYLELGNQNWVPLYPFVVASNCPNCRYRETYFIDRWNDRKGTVLMKSFERGHTEERRDVSDSLVALTSELQEPRD